MIKAALSFLVIMGALAALAIFLELCGHGRGLGGYASYAFGGYANDSFYRVGPGIEAAGRVVDGDIGDSVRFCRVETEFFCMDSSFIEFAIPLHELKVGERWAFKDAEFELLPSYMYAIPGGIEPNSDEPIWSYRILGHDYRLYIIKAEIQEKDKKWTRIFFFSREHGLIGYMRPGQDNENATFWLTGEDGPGSVNFDIHIVPDAYLKPTDVLPTQLPTKH